MYSNSCITSEYLYSPLFPWIIPVFLGILLNSPIFPHIPLCSSIFPCIPLYSPVFLCIPLYSPVFPGIPGISLFPGIPQYSPVLFLYPNVLLHVFQLLYSSCIPLYYSFIPLYSSCITSFIPTPVLLLYYFLYSNSCEKTKSLRIKNMKTEEN